MSRRSIPEPGENEPTEIYDRGHQVRDRSEPIRVISMKTPAAVDKPAPQAKPHEVKLRSIGELSGPAIQVPLGNLAPPRDPKQARIRRVRDYAIVGCAVVIVGCVVMIGVWLLARG